MTRLSENEELKRISTELQKLWDDLEEILQDNYEPDELDDPEAQKELELETAGFCDSLEEAMDLIDEAIDSLSEITTE